MVIIRFHGFWGLTRMIKLNIFVKKIAKDFSRATLPNGQKMWKLCKTLK